MNEIEAVAVLTNTTIPSIKGVIYFREDVKNDKVIIYADIIGMPPGKHGFHIHQAGDLTDNCTSACEHFNPYEMTHGGPKDMVRHVGDLGNLVVKNGKINDRFTDHLIKLRGTDSIIGRSVVIHKLKDDLGRGGLNKRGEIIDLERYQESLKTGNAGARIACGVIGYSKNMFKC